MRHGSMNYVKMQDISKPSIKNNKPFFGGSLVETCGLVAVSYSIKLIGINIDLPGTADKRCSVS